MSLRTRGAVLEAAIRAELRETADPALAGGCDHARADHDPHLPAQRRVRSPLIEHRGRPEQIEQRLKREDGRLVQVVVDAPTGKVVAVH